MLPGSQPLDPKFYKKLGLNDDVEREEMSKDNIESQRIGEIFDDIFDGSRKSKLSFKKNLDSGGAE